MNIIEFRAQRSRTVKIRGSTSISDQASRLHTSCMVPETNKRENNILN
jgi:hypothetical protein